jgi:hypothetical protein
VSSAFVDLEEDAFEDSFDDDDDDDNDETDGTTLEPLAEGASNPLDLLADYSGGDVQQAHQADTGGTDTHQSPAPDLTATDGINKESGFGQAQSPAPDLKTADGIDRELETLDFGFGPGNLSPVLGSAPAADNLPGNQGGDLNFDFDFGLPVKGDDPFSSNLEATGNRDLADFDLGKLDANFFEKLEAIEVTDQVSPWGEAPQNTGMGNQDLDQFWGNIDTSVSKF